MVPDSGVRGHFNVVKGGPLPGMDDAVGIRRVWKRRLGFVGVSGLVRLLQLAMQSKSNTLLLKKKKRKKKKKKKKA
jgi:hypothetical protein